MNIEVHTLHLQSKWHTGDMIEITLDYRGNEHIRIEFELGDEKKYICVPRFELEKFIEMIKGK